MCSSMVSKTRVPSSPNTGVSSSRAPVISALNTCHSLAAKQVTLLVAAQSLLHASNAGSLMLYLFLMVCVEH